MLSQEYPKLQIDPTSTHEEDLTKSTRLSEVRKGADFTKMVNQLADQQWRGTSVMPRIIETEERDTPRKDGDGAPFKLEDSSCNVYEPKLKMNDPQFKFDEPKLMQMTKGAAPPRRTTPLAPVSRQGGSGRSSIGTVSREIQNIPSRRDSLISSILNIETSSNKNNRNLQKINNNINNNNINNILNSNKAVLPDISGQSFRDRSSSVDLKELYYFNTWGSRDLGLDSKLVPDEVPRVVAPKQSVPSSRVGSQGRDRQLRTETDFRSRNGLVRIVKPHKPLPPIARTEYPEADPAYDLDNLGREKTYVTLKRIDQILNPQQAFVKSELNSSELGILGSGSTTPKSVKKKKREHVDKVVKSFDGILDHSKGNASYINHSGGVTVVHTYPSGHHSHPHQTAQYPHTFQNAQHPYPNGQHPHTSQNVQHPYPKGQYPHTYPTRQPHPPTKAASKPSSRISSKNPNRSLSPVLKCLDTEKVTSYEKCMKWVDKCSEWYD
ncbi:hypothetical protein SNE40_012258 [Patella caerulea]|uniref:Uncharacterized protein n=1 Tax=Patella caerulea TaxID=87958 RepID=A0AAN8JNF2_PATCE